MRYIRTGRGVSIFAIFGDKIEQEGANLAKPVFIPTAPDQLCETDIEYVW